MSEVAPLRLDVAEMRSSFRHLAGRLDIFLDGELVHDVVSYNVEDGMIVRNARDIGGDLVIDETGEKLATETLHGKVRVHVRGESQCHA